MNIGTLVLNIIFKNEIKEIQKELTNDLDREIESKNEDLIYEKSIEKLLDIKSELSSLQSRRNQIRSDGFLELNTNTFAEGDFRLQRKIESIVNKYYEDKAKVSAEKYIAALTEGLTRTMEQSKHRSL